MAINYTQDQVEYIVNQYRLEPTRETVEKLSLELEKSVKSIIGKLSREGVYIAQPRTTKSGEPVVSKSELVDTIANHFDIELPTLVKAGKADLQRLVDAISQ